MITWWSFLGVATDRWERASATLHGVSCRGHAPSDEFSNCDKARRVFGMGPRLVAASMTAEHVAGWCGDGCVKLIGRAFGFAVDRIWWFGALGALCVYVLHRFIHGAQSLVGHAMFAHQQEQMQRLLMNQPSGQYPIRMWRTIPESTPRVEEA